MGSSYLYDGPKPVDVEIGLKAFTSKEAKQSESPVEENLSSETTYNVEAYALWDLPRVDLAQSAADFYLLEFMSGVLENDAATRILERKTLFLARVFKTYLNFAVGGELRHIIKKADISHESDIEVKKFYPHPKPGVTAHVPRATAWVGWHRVFGEYGVEAVSAAEHMFKTQSWHSGYGGLAWGKIANLLALYLAGKVRPKVFVDTVWSIQHNGGTVLNKAPERLFNLDLVKTVLNYQDAEDVEALEKFCSSSIRDMYGELKLVASGVLAHG